MAVKWASFQAFDQFGGEVEHVDLYQVDKAGSGELITSLLLLDSPSARRNLARVTTSTALTARAFDCVRSYRIKPMFGLKGFWYSAASCGLVARSDGEAAAWPE